MFSSFIDEIIERENKPADSGKISKNIIELADMVLGMVLGVDKQKMNSVDYKIR